MTSINSTNFPSDLSKRILEYAKDNNKNLFEYQKIISNYMLEDHVKGMLLYWEVGTGKTLTAVNIAESLRKLKRMDVIVISPKSLKDNFIRTLQRYTNTNNQIYKNLKINDELDDKTDDETNTSNISTTAYYESFESVVKHYSFLTYGSPNMIKEMLKSSIKDTEYSDFIENKYLSNKVIIVDEAHNLFNSITNGAIIASQFYDLVMKSNNIKLLFLTGTPIINNFFEIVPALNMCKGYLNDNLFNNHILNKRHKQQYTLLPESYDDFIKMFVDTETNQIKNADKLKNRIYGLVSYYGNYYLSKHTRFQNSTKESEKKDNFPTRLPIRFIKVNMDRMQNMVYLEARASEQMEIARNKILAKKFGKGTLNNDSEYLSESQIGQMFSGQSEGGKILKDKGIGSTSYRIKSRQISNIYIPDQQSILKFSELATDKPDTKSTNANTGKQDEINETVGTDESTETDEIVNDSVYSDTNISPKFQAIIDNCLKHKNQLGLIYSNFLKYGLSAIAYFLDKTEYKGKYKLYTGDIDIEERNQIIQDYNNINNKHGEIIELLLISSTGAKGLNLKRVRHIHIMEPDWSRSNTEQVIGRGVRYKSHEDLPLEEQNVQVYEYMSDYNLEYLKTNKPIEPTTDLTLFYNSIKNKEINDELLKIIASASIECPYFNKYINFNCFTCEANNRPLYIPNIHDDIKIQNPCKNLKLHELLFNKQTYYYDTNLTIYQKNNFNYYQPLPQTDPNHSQILTYLKKNI